MSEIELKNIKGGLSISASLISAIVRGANAMLEIGRSFGSTIRRVFMGKTCSL